MSLIQNYSVCLSHVRNWVRLEYNLKQSCSLPYEDYCSENLKSNKNVICALVEVQGDVSEQHIKALGTVVSNP